MRYNNILYYAVHCLLLSVFVGTKALIRWIALLWRKLEKCSIIYNIFKDSNNKKNIQCLVYHVNTVINDGSENVR